MSHVHTRVWLTNASPHRPIVRYRRSKHRKLFSSLKPVAGTPLWQLTLSNPSITQLIRHNFQHFSADNAPLATENKRTENTVSRLIIDVKYVLCFCSCHFLRLLTFFLLFKRRISMASKSSTDQSRGRGIFSASSHFIFSFSTFRRNHWKTALFKCC